jgi:hypothetical protein
MKHLSVMASAIGLLASVGSVSAWAGSDPFTGTWHWNRAASSTTPGEPVPKDVTLQIASANAAKVESTITLTDDQGQKHVSQFNGVGDGKPRALAGGGQGVTVAFTLTGTSLQTTVRSPDGGSDIQTCTVSPDQRQLSCKGTESDGKGHSQDYTDVYDRS